MQGDVFKGYLVEVVQLQFREELRLYTCQGSRRLTSFRLQQCPLATLQCLHAHSCTLLVCDYDVTETLAGIDDSKQFLLQVR